MPHKIYHLNGRSHENDEVIVPRNNYTKIIVHAAPQVAAQFDSLDVNCNTITSIQRVTRLTGVDFVNGEDSDYDEVPRWIVHLPALDEIKFCNNNIQEIPDWLLDSCHNLTVLNISNCQLNGLPHDLFDYNLRNVFLSDNCGE